MGTRVLQPCLSLSKIFAFQGDVCDIAPRYNVSTTKALHECAYTATGEVVGNVHYSLFLEKALLR
jgi:hypothetical protein